MTMECPSSAPWSSAGSSIIMLSVSSSPKVSREITVVKTQQSSQSNAGGQTFNVRQVFVTCDSVQLHAGVGVRQNLRLVKSLEDGS